MNEFVMYVHWFIDSVDFFYWLGSHPINSIFLENCKFWIFVTIFFRFKGEQVTMFYPPLSPKWSAQKKSIEIRPAQSRNKVRTFLEPIINESFLKLFEANQ